MRIGTRLRGATYIASAVTIAGLPGAGQATPALAQDLFVQNARVVDPAAREIRTGNLLIRDGRIAGILEAPPAGFGGEVLDVDGKWLIPGLVDLHTHSYGNMAPGQTFESPGTGLTAQRMLYAGVTGMLDLFGMEAALFAVRERQRSGELVAADIFVSGACLTATDGHCTEYGVPTRTMDTPGEARRHVNQLADKTADVIKIVYAPTGRMPSIDKPTLAAAVETANQRGLPTVIHVNTWQDVRDAVEVGATAVTHVPLGPIPEGLAALMAERGVHSIPTLAVQTDFRHFVTDPDVLGSPLAQRLTTSGILGAYRTDEVIAHVEEDEAERSEEEATTLASVKAMADAGVTILTGTDSGNYGTIQGYSEHRELVKLVEAGLTPWEALAAATTDAGGFLGRPYGVATGDVANLVVLDASPIEDIRNTQEIAAVIHHGKVIDREALVPSP